MKKTKMEEKICYKMKRDEPPTPYYKGEGRVEQGKCSELWHLETLKGRTEQIGMRLRESEVRNLTKKKLKNLYILNLERCKGVSILKISNNAAK